MKVDIERLEQAETALEIVDQELASARRVARILAVALVVSIVCSFVALVAAY